jgi:MazG family protein
MEYPQIKRAIEVIKQLRHPTEGCPWDLEQDHQSLLKYLIEESYEFLHATEENQIEKMEEELGDVLLQVILHSQIASESHNFNIESVAQKLADKMIRRHPHVFQDKTLAVNSEQVLQNWEKIKQKEKKDKAEHFFNKEDLCLPALMSAHKIGKKSAKVNFDWDHIKDVLLKVEEELAEVKAEMAHKDNHEKIKEEIGDLLFSVAQLARHLDIEAEEALREANKKFVTRFSLLEKMIQADQKDMLRMSVPELEEYWAKVKAKLKKG